MKMGIDIALIDGVRIPESRIIDALSPHHEKSTKAVAASLKLVVTEKAMQELGITLARMAREGLLVRGPNRKPTWRRNFR